MFSIGQLPTGVSLIITAVVLYVMIRILLRVVPLIRPNSQRASQKPVIRLDIPPNDDAVLIVQPGGRVVYASPVVREWFGLSAEEEPNLERMVRLAEPGESFLSLCATAGQARFTVQKALVEGVSFSMPDADEKAILVTLRRPQFSGLTPDQGELSGQALSIFTELSQAMTASLDLETTIRTILERVDHLVQSDFSEITIWDGNTQRLVPYRYSAGQGIERQLEKTRVVYLRDEGYSGYLATKRKALLVEDVDSFDEAQPTIDRRRHPFNSYLGIPLTMAGELIGTLELAAHERDAFSKSDLETLNVLAGQAAVALQNALIHQAERQRAIELAGLAELAQIGGSFQEPQDLISRLVDGLAPILNVNMLGVLLYDKTRQSLEGQAPFLGIPDQFIEVYRAEILPGSRAEETWRAHEIIQTENPGEDASLRSLGIGQLAETAGIQKTVLLPLSSSGNAIGYLQAANKKDNSSFDHDDLRLLTIIAGQAAPIIENTLLIQESRRRTQRSEALRRIASLVGSAATMDEVLQFSLRELVNLLQADCAVIPLLDDDLGELQLHIPSLIGISKEAAQSLKGLATNHPDFKYTSTSSKQSLLAGDVTVESPFPAIYDNLMGQFDEVQSVISVPIVVRERGIGEIIVVSRQAQFFTNSDIQTAATVASQLGSVIERSVLYTQTDESLQRRVEQLTSLTRVSRELNTTVELEHLLQRVYDEILRTTKADCGSILLFESGNGEATAPVIGMYLGDEPGQELGPMEKQVIENGEALIVDDFEQSDFAPSHEGIGAALVVPIAYQETVAGLIHLHSQKPNHFDGVSLEITQALAVQAAIALGNAQRYQDQVKRGEMLHRQVEALGKLFETAQNLHVDQPLEVSMEAIAYGIQEATRFEVVLMYAYDEQQDALRSLGGAGLPVDALKEMVEATYPWGTIAEALTPEFLMSKSYFIPQEKLPKDFPSLSSESSLLSYTILPEAEKEAWLPGDMLMVPLMDGAGNPVGLISVDAPRSGLRPDKLAIETLEIFAQEATLVMESSSQLQALKDQVNQIEDQVNRAEQASSMVQDNMSMLLHKDLEQTIAIQQLNSRARRIRVGLDIAEIANRQPDRSAVLLALGHQMITQMDLDIALVAEQSGSGPRLVHSLGATPQGANPEALLGQRNPLNHTLQSGEALLVPNLEANADWQNTSLLKSLNAKGFISLPISSNGQVEAAVLAISLTPVASFTKEDEQIYDLIGSQVAIALQNLKLLTETRRRLREVNLLLDFSRQLGSLDPTEILNTLITSALRVMTNAHAGTVALWDDEQGLLVPQASSGYTDNELILKIMYQSGEALPGQVFASGQPVRVDEVDFVKQYNLSSDNLMTYREATGGRVPVSSLLVPIQAGEKTLGVMTLDNFNAPQAFSIEDEALVASLAQQTALTLENARLFQASEQRAGQLQSLTDVATMISSSLDSDALVASLLDQLYGIIPFDTGTLWLRQGDDLTVRAARGFSDSEDRTGLKVRADDSALLGKMISSGEAISISDLQNDQNFPAQTGHLFRSWLGMPLISKNEVVGVIALEKIEPSFYTREHIQATKTFAGQAAVALENARLYEESLRRAQELDRRSQRLGQLNRISNELSASLDPDHLLRFTAEELFQAVNCTAVSGVLFSADNIPLLKVEVPSKGVAGIQSLPNAPIFERIRQSLGVLSSEDVLREKDLEGLGEFFTKRGTRSILALPLATGSDLHGVFLIHADKAYRFLPAEIELALTISNQAAVGLQNARLFEETRRFTEELEQRVAERTAALAEEHKYTRTLLSISTELSSSLDLDHVLNLSLTRLMESTDAEQTSILLARDDEPNLVYRAGMGMTKPPPTGGRPSSFKKGEGMASWMIENRKPILINDLMKDQRWVVKGQTAMHRSVIAAPLTVGEDALGALMLYHRNPNHFNEDQINLIQAAANQFAVAINNGELYRLIAGQAESLGTMLRNQKVEASRSTAMLEGVADGVLVTDADGVVTLFNHAGELILELDSSQVVGKSLDVFTGLFGGAAQAWTETIRKWSDDPATQGTAESYSERILLEDGRVVSVRLAPVSTRDEYLGTVSVFRDITHEVEVDRLKSEFVATVSHELRTPMTPIKGYVEFLLMGGAGELSAEQTQFLDVIKGNVDRLSILVNDLLDVSRIEAGGINLDFQAVNIRELAEEVIANTVRQSMEQEKPMKIELEAD
ncbi:MAG: GAF domain-containing protein, partial [Anaerolineae bacterium]|nr:GAF domain-containing protein [Anaerolineae bacterium]